MTHAKLSLECRPAEIGRLPPFLADFIQRNALPEASVFSLNLVLEEIVLNILTYGEGSPPDTRITVELELKDDTLKASIIDNAKPFNPLAVPPPDLDAPLADKAVGGMGIHIVRTIVDHMTYNWDGSYNILNLYKKIDRNCL